MPTPVTALLPYRLPYLLSYLLRYRSKDPGAPRPGRAPGRAATLAAAALIAALQAGCADFAPFRAVRIASASTSQTLCTAAFVSGLDPDAAYRDEVRPAPGMSLIAWGLRYRVDPSAREVSTDIAGMAYRKAIYREDLGCAVDFGGEPGDAMGQVSGPASAKPGSAKPGSAGSASATSRAPARPAAAVPASTDPWSNDPFPTLAAPGIVQTGDERLRRAIDDAFVEPDAGARRRTQAVVVVHRGRLLAERYAPDVGPDTPLPGHSISKSVTHALIGVLARQHRLDPDRPVPVPAWQAPDDPRAGITPNHLLAMASGLRWDERHGGWDEATRHWFDEPDPAAYAVSVPAVARPNEQWGYSNLGYTVLSRLLREAAGGRAADVLALAQRELFGPTGMRQAVMTFDSTGTPQGSNLFLASARDWARFGLLYLNDGLAGTRRILPPGWVAAARTPTLDAGYGSGFWLNHTDAPHPLPGRWGMPGAPADAYFARGYLGQFIVIVPSLDLVVVRLGISYRPGGDIATVGRMVGALAAILRDRPEHPSQAHLTQAGPAQASPVQANPVQAGPAQASPARAGPAPAGPSGPGAALR